MNLLKKVITYVISFILSQISRIFSKLVEKGRKRPFSPSFSKILEICPRTQNNLRLFWALDLVLVKLIIEIFELCKIDMWEFCFKSRIKDNNLCYLCILVKISQIFSKFFENAFRHFLKISRRFSKFWPRTQNNYRFFLSGNAKSKTRSPRLFFFYHSKF